MLNVLQPFPPHPLSSINYTTARINETSKISGVSTRKPLIVSPPNILPIMGSDSTDMNQKPRFLCLHGFRTSGEILKKQVGKWPESVLKRLDLVFVDAPLPAKGKSDVEGVFEPPYYEWFQFNKDFTEYEYFEECLEYIEDCMIKHGPIDGFLGFSQGAILSAALPAMQAKGMALRRVPKVKFLIIIGGAKFKLESLAEQLYSSRIECLSIHFLGKDDFLRPHGTELLKSFVDPFIIHHPKGHTVPRIDDQSLPIMVSFLDKIEKTMSEQEEKMMSEKKENMTIEIAVDARGA